MAGKYQSNADALVSEKADKLAQLLGATLQNSQRAKIEQQQRENDMAMAQQLQQQNPEVPVRIGDASIGARDPLASFLRAQQLQNLEDDRLDRAVERGSKALIESNLPQAQEAFKRLESITPGLAAGKAQPKSVGGLKNLIPNVFSAPAEKLGILPQGSADERAALQELSNVKIYDASGKAINEAEMERIKDSLGTRGIFDPQTIQQALQQMGMSIVRKGETAEAGIRPKAKQLLQQRGAVSVDPLRKMLQGGAVAPQAAPGQAPMSFEEWKAAKKAGKL